MPDIYWLIAAQRRFLEAMQPRVRPEEYVADYRMICQRLAATFPEANAVIVRDRLHGYRNPSDRHILLVEVVHKTERLAPIATRPLEGKPTSTPSDRPEIRAGWPEFLEPDDKRLGLRTQTSAHIVKIAKEVVNARGATIKGSRILADELSAWERCRPVGMTHDSILMRLRPGAWDEKGELLSIVYEDAHHVIGMGEVAALEDVVAGCCAFGTPTVSSLTLLIRTLYERFGSDFYTRSCVEKNEEKNLKTLTGWKHFTEWFDGWKDDLAPAEKSPLDRLQTRREVLGLLAHERDRLIDPVDYLRSVAECPQYCPLMLWGCSDGDLHGRNVLVSVIGDDVGLPAVFDYADMGLENLVGWDFVKLETELKVRILPGLYPAGLAEFVPAVLRFEHHLAACSQAIHDQKKDLPKIDLGPKGASRLARIILAIRQQARQHLQVRRMRDRQWLEEHYFLLACYGVYAARFDTYQSNTRLIAAAYISAGVGARQLTRPSTQLNRTINEMEQRAKELTANVGFDPGTHQLDKPKCEMSHHARLAFARGWVRSRKADFIGAAITILESIRAEYPHVLEIDEELALAYLEANGREAFEELLQNVMTRYKQPSEEFLCRTGRYGKDRGKEAESQDDQTSAKRFYEDALSSYQSAFALRHHYYPGINLAGLQFVLGRLDNSRATAARVLTSLDQPWPPGQEHWARLTRADAQFLLGNDAEAERLYREGLHNANPHARATSRAQLEMLLKHAPAAQRVYWTAETLRNVFDPPAPPLEAKKD